MSDDTVITVSDLGKLYQLGLVHHDLLAEKLTAGLRTLFRGFRRPASASEAPRRSFPAETGSDNIWALRHLSFEVRRGEVLGLIGRNGAGKSTLLKILTGITEPTEGRARIKGRVGSLLEIGTGFHAELTGRENIFVSGAILGMTRAEVRHHFDAIVDFAGDQVATFLDTPVKRYSSGMYVRLAFAVAAHLQTEILLVDEVLAVGDVEFQKKCLGKMGSVAREGRTILFVSHNMGAIHRLCTRATCLENGQVKSEGRPADVIAGYLRGASGPGGERSWPDPARAPGDEHVRLRAVRMLDADRQVNSTLDIRKPFYVEIEYDILQSAPHLRTGFRVCADDGTLVFTGSDNANGNGYLRPIGSHISRCEIPGHLLNEGFYSLLDVWADLPTGKALFRVDDLLPFQMLHTNGSTPDHFDPSSGLLSPKLTWEISSHT